MGKRHKHLINAIASPENVSRALTNTARGKRKSYGYKVFARDIEGNLSKIQRELTSGEYTPGEPRYFLVYEPKERSIAALPFYDRVVQHTLCDILNPIFDKVFLPQSYACRKGRGTHKAAMAVQASLRRLEAQGEKVWVLKTDFIKYFHNIPTDALLKEYSRKVKCERTMGLIRKFVPPGQVGIPIGHLTSQLSANICGHIVDRWLVHEKGVTTFFRYMDDIVILGTDRGELTALYRDLHEFITTQLGLRFSHWSIQPASRGVNFVGYRIWSSHKLLRRDSVIKAKRKIKKYEAKGDNEGLARFLASWLGHAKWADTRHLIEHLGLYEA